MAQNKVLLTVFLALLAGCAVLIGCAGEGAGNSSERGGNNVNSTDKQEPGTFPGLDVETERQLKLDYINYAMPTHERSKYTIDRVYIIRYYGNYNGCVVVLMHIDDTEYAQVITGITVANMNFVFSNSNVARAWYQSGEPGSGRFYGLAEAYDLGLLTEDDIRNMYEVHISSPLPSQEPGTFPGLDAETERQIIQDFGEPAWGINNYYGIYNGWVVVRINMPVPGVVQIVTIGGFDFNVLPPIIAWKDGQIHDLKDAYDAGLLTQDNIRSIAEGGKKFGTFPGLDAETERQIIQDRFNKYGTSSSILRYLGTYNGCVVIQFPYSPMTVVWHEKIDDIWFHDASPPGITVWKDGVFYTMTALYEQGLLTREDLLTIFDIHEELKAIPAIHEKLKEGYFGKN
jgi:hypothetical protein